MDGTKPSYIVYIDEAGDPGIKRYPRSDSAAYEWFTLGAFVVREEIDQEIVNWVRDARKGIKSSQSAVLHYRNLAPAGKLKVCSHLGGCQSRGFVVASHKTNMRQHINHRLPLIEQASRYYNWCLRILLERVTEWCLAQSLADYGEKRPVKLVFSKRGGHNYEKLFSYLFDILRWQEEAGTLYLKRPAIRGMLLRELSEVVPADDRAGLQVADVIASAFLMAANSALPSFDLEPAKMLARIMARPGPRQSKANFGVTLLPLPEQAAIPENDRAIFQHYGFSI